MRSLIRSVALASVLWGCAATTASADWLVTPYAGISWRTAARFNDAALFYDDEFTSRLLFGGAVTWMKGSLGFEFDFGYQPQIFKDRSQDDFFEWGDSRVMTMMANVSYAPEFLRFGGVRPFGSGGVGVISTFVEDPQVVTVESTDLAVNAGGGVSVPVGSRLEIRGDMRYFRTLEDNQPDREIDVALGKLHFWRTTFGLTIRF